MALTIEELSVQTKVNPSTIRYYERRAVLLIPQQSKAGSREYDTVDIKRVRFVRFSRLLGMELDEIRALIEMIGEGNSEEIDIVEQVMLERASRLTRFCVNLKNVSAAIRTGEIDEANAFSILSTDGETTNEINSNNRPEKNSSAEGMGKKLTTQISNLKGRPAKS
ncbi:MerR family transcriptional regulator [Methylobacterium sp. WL9]|uniref:MerR family transcriptional regulator n=1 Tax=Methylobacterium sp. WL9 TaxID=2603898 RepID=UPI0011C82E56|nr:MerR family transcriptional regulator [Methylobacterium sp. WL9]TXN22141.1 MerR family transcriptional regulator [Methylobacterium sp. WL9]